MLTRMMGAFTVLGLAAALLLVVGLVLGTCSAPADNQGEQRMNQADNVSLEVSALPPIDKQQPDQFETATFAVG